MSHGSAGFDFAKITVDLTSEGLCHWQDVALAIFKYISLLRSSRPSFTIFDEIKQIADISFRFAERSKNHRYVTGLSNSMQHPVPREKIVSSGSLLEEFRADEISAVLQLLDPRRATIGVTSKELPPGVEGTFDRTEPIYGTEYKQVQFSEDFMRDVSFNSTKLTPGDGRITPV